MKFAKDAIMKNLVDETRCLSSRLNGEKHQQNQGVKYEKDLLEKSSMTNPFKYDGGNITSQQASDKEYTSKVHNNNPFKKPYSRVVPKYENELQEELGLNVPINPFKRDMIANGESNKQISTNQNQWNPFKVKEKEIPGITASSPMKVKEDCNDDDGIPEKYRNLPSNVHLNPFKYPKASLNRNNDNNNTAQSNKERPSKTWVNRPKVVPNTKSSEKTLKVASNTLKAWVKPPNKKPQLKRRAEENNWESDGPCFKRRRLNSQEGKFIYSYFDLPRFLQF